MAYQATALYIAGTMALLASSSLWTNTGYASSLIPTISLIIAIVVCLFVWWQFKHRHWAAYISDACKELATLWLNHTPLAAHLEPVEVSGEGWNFYLPMAVKTRAGYWKERDLTRTPEWLMTALIFTCPVILALRTLLAAFPCSAA